MADNSEPPFKWFVSTYTCTTLTEWMAEANNALTALQVTDWQHSLIDDTLSFVFEQPLVDEKPDEPLGYHATLLPMMSVQTYTAMTELVESIMINPEYWPAPDESKPQFPFMLDAPAEDNEKPAEPDYLGIARDVSA